MNTETEKVVDSNIAINNACNVLKKLQSAESKDDGQFLTMIQANSFNGVEVTDLNISNNSKFIMELWS